MAKNPLEKPPGDTPKKSRDWGKYQLDMEEARKRTKEITETPEGSAALMEAWKKLQRRTGPTTEKPPASIRPEIVEKIRQGKKHGLNVLTPDEKSELFDFLMAIVAETTLRSRTAHRFLEMLDPDFSSGIKLTNEDHQRLLDLLTGRA